MQYLFLDVEASRLFDRNDPDNPALQPRLAQLGMMFVNSKCEIESQHEFLIRPRGWVMTPEATEKTGITTEYLEEHGGPIEPALDLYHRALESRRVVAGFNLANYDLKVLRRELRAHNMTDLYMETKSMCLMSASRQVVKALDKNGRVKAPRLDEACAFFNIEQPAAHSALADAMSTYQLWMRLIDMRVIPEIKDPYNKKPKAKPARRKAGAKDDTAEEGDEISIQNEIPL